MNILMVSWLGLVIFVRKLDLGAFYHGGEGKGWGGVGVGWRHCKWRLRSHRGDALFRGVRG